MKPAQQLCQFWPEYHVSMKCDEPGEYKFTFPEGRGMFLCKKHFLGMADITIQKEKNGEGWERKRAKQIIEINNYFFHE